MENTARQQVLADTKTLLQFIKPISVHTFWHVVAKDPRFPKPVIGGGQGAKALHSLPAVSAYLEEVARTGFMGPDGSTVTRRAA